MPKKSSLYYPERSIGIQGTIVELSKNKSKLKKLGEKWKKEGLVKHYKIIKPTRYTKEWQLWGWKHEWQ